jgi:LPS-assembly protein
MQNFRLRPITLSLLWLLANGAYGDEDVTLAPAKDLSHKPVAEPTPLFIDADRLQGVRDQNLEAFGDVDMRKEGESVAADYLIYRQPEDEVFAKGHVRIEQNSSSAAGPEMRLKLEQNLGYMESPVYQLTDNNARGDAKRLLFEGKDKYRLLDARYTTCSAGSDDWFLHAADLEIDRTTQIGTAHHAYVEFKGVPLLYTPWMTFPLVAQRKSGFLAPSIGSTGNSGWELTTPYYWNIAPNRDATISPRFMLKRGLQLRNELRYLESNYVGEADVEVLPGDRITHSTRHFLALQHQQNLGNGWTGSLNLQRASDDNYFRDLSTLVASTSLTFLPREGTLSYAKAPWNFTARIQGYQTLQDPLAPVVPPYSRLPQLLLNASKPDVYGADLALASEFVDFSHPTLVNGRRFMLYPSVSLPLRQTYGYLIPKIGLHMTRYTLGEGATTPDITRTVPIFSADSGLYFERDWGVGDTQFLQTLEPRLYYVYVPTREQSQIPVFDTGEAGFNLAKMFSENQFTGPDRINDANQVTAALTSRLVDPDSGVERLRAGVAQRFYFKEQEVTLSSPARSRNFSDLLFSLSGPVTPAWLLDALIQYDPAKNTPNNSSLSAHYLPAPGKVLNLSFRYQQDLLKQIDISGQWPLYGRWSGMARYNYSLLDSKVLEALAGLEYNGGCWASRVVIHQLTTATAEVSNAFFLQLELNGVSQIGPNPLDILKQNIIGYTKSNE